MLYRDLDTRQVNLNIFVNTKINPVKFSDDLPSALWLLAGGVVQHHVES